MIKKYRKISPIREFIQIDTTSKCVDFLKEWIDERIYWSDGDYLYIGRSGKKIKRGSYVSKDRIGNIEFWSQENFEQNWVEYKG